MAQKEEVDTICCCCCSVQKDQKDERRGDAVGMMEMCSGFIALLCFRPGRVCIAAVLVVDSWKTEEEEEEGKKNELSRLIHGQEDKKRTPSISFIPVNYSQDSTAAAAFFFFFSFSFSFFFCWAQVREYTRRPVVCMCVWHWSSYYVHRITPLQKDAKKRVFRVE